MMPGRCRLLPIEQAVASRGPLSIVAARVLSVLLMLAAGCTAASPGASGAPPSRIVALAPSVTEVVYGLGQGARLVGVCAQCDHPPQAKRLPRMGGYLAPSVEAVLAARPDLVLVVPSPGNREAVRTLERAGVRVLVTGDRTLDDLWAAIASIADALHVPGRGAEMVRRVRDQLDAVHRRVGAFPPARALLVVGHRPLIVAGGGTLQDELLRVAGGINVAADAGTAFPEVPLELVVARAPEVILDAAMGTEAGGRDLFADLRSVPAVRDGRIITVAPDTLFRAGPRVGEAAAQLAAALHPEAPQS
jgi:iron complex transport system substrate-binding protein